MEYAVLDQVRTADRPTRYTLYLLIYLELDVKMGEH